MVLRNKLTIIIVTVYVLPMYLTGAFDTDESINLYLFDNYQSNGTLFPRGDYARIDPNKEILFIFHGFNAEWNDYTEISQLHVMGNPRLLVINVDAKKLFAGPNYVNAIRNAELIGNFIGDLMVELNLDGNKVRCMGGSLGAHAAGFAGKRFQALTGEKIYQIVGNDPAGVLFDLYPDFMEDLRLSENDATVVITLITNRGVMGTTHNWGRVNFYVNNGVSQPGCTFPDTVCSHYYAIKIYTESILKPKYKGIRMEKWSFDNKPIGLDPKDTLYFLGPTPVGKSGLYHFNTV